MHEAAGNEKDRLQQYISVRLHSENVSLNIRADQTH